MLKNTTVKTVFYENFNQLEQHIKVFLLYYNHQKPCKKLKFIPPYQKILDFYKKDSSIFIENPIDKIAKPNIIFF